MTLYEKLSKVQQKLKAPKGQYNDFGGYNYRSCEDIVEATKPLLAEENLVMTISDELLMIGDRYYIKANVTVIDTETGDKHEVNGYAREAEKKEGMDDSQITGAASSYARKYALNGMFAIDDTKDADATNKHAKMKKRTILKGRKIITLKMANIIALNAEKRLNKQYMLIQNNIAINLFAEIASQAGINRMVIA